jgi:hypothetical protein
MRRADVIGISLFLCLLAFIGVSFLVSGIELRENAVRTTATVVKVHKVHRGRSSDHLFTLKFTDRQGNELTEQTDHVRMIPAIPSSGDRIGIYYASNDPANLSDVRFGSPGSYDFFMATTFGSLVIAIPIIARLILIIRKRLGARRRQKLIAWPSRSSSSHPSGSGAAGGGDGGALHD